MVTDSLLREIGQRIHDAGGRALLVGGCVRDALLGQTPKDYDIEVFGLDAPELTAALASFGPALQIGASFAVQKIRGLDIDFSLPRAADFTEAARFRDLTINSMGQDIVTGELLDPHGGQADLAARILRATDARYFGADPLRGMRVAALAARFEMTPDQALLDLCAALDLSRIPAERLLEEWRKLLLRARAPSRGLAILRDTGLLRFFPELHAMLDVPQDPTWHPEGDVWIHTCMVIDEAAALRTGGPGDLTLMLAALLHDVGKPGATAVVDGRIRSSGHEVAGVAPCETFLNRLRAPKDTTLAVASLVRHHLAPALLPRAGAKDKAYRRLARELQNAGADIDTLLRLARADHWGRTTEDARLRRFSAGDEFAQKIASLELSTARVRDVVLGRHLLERGYKPGPEMGIILARCRDVQDETGWTEAGRILARVLETEPVDASEVKTAREEGA